MTKELLYNIAFWIVAISFTLRIIWELISEGQKQYWKYQQNLRRDKRKGRRRKYNWSWRVGKFDKEF